MRHDVKIGHLAEQSPSGIELFVNKRTYGKNRWEQLYNYPDVGLSLSYFDLKNENLGKAINIFTYLNFYLLRRSHHEIFLKVGTGLVFSTNPYDKETNNKNVAIGSTLTYGIQSRIGYNLKLTELLKLSTGVTLTHFSNGAFKVPNKGLNIVTANAGLAYALGASNHDYLESNNPFIYDTKLKVNVNVSGGLKELYPIGSGKFPFYTLSFYVEKRTGPASALNIGVDGFYNLALKESRKFDTELKEGENPDFKRVGLTFGHELFINKLSVLTQLGVYIYRPYKKDFAIYQRYGLKYYFNNNFFGSLNLKSHYAIADAVEFGVGFKL